MFSLLEKNKISLKDDGGGCGGGGSDGPFGDGGFGDGVRLQMNFYTRKELAFEVFLSTRPMHFKQSNGILNGTSCSAWSLVGVQGNCGDGEG